MTRDGFVLLVMGWTGEKESAMAAMLIARSLKQSIGHDLGRWPFFRRPRIGFRWLAWWLNGTRHAKAPLNKRFQFYAKHFCNLMRRQARRCHVSNRFQLLDRRVPIHFVTESKPARTFETVIADSIKAASSLDDNCPIASPSLSRSII